MTAVEIGRDRESVRVVTFEFYEARLDAGLVACAQAVAAVEDLPMMRVIGWRRPWVRISSTRAAYSPP